MRAGQQKCTKCGTGFTPKPGPGRPRKRCERCRPPEQRRASQAPLVPPTRLHVEPARPEQPSRVGEPPPPVRSGLVAVVDQELTAARRADTAKGAIALRLAETLADGGHTASGIAALAKELRATLDEALKGAEEAGDSVDELKARRERRRGA